MVPPDPYAIRAVSLHCNGSVVHSLASFLGLLKYVEGVHELLVFELINLSAMLMLRRCVAARSARKPRASGQPSTGGESHVGGRFIDFVSLAD